MNHQFDSIILSEDEKRQIKVFQARMMLAGLAKFDIDIETGTIISCKAYTSEIKLPPYIKAIRKEAFEYNTRLESITIPEGIKIIPEGCFGCCYNLKHVNLPDSLEVICKNAFTECYKIKRICLGPNVWAVMDGAFMECNLSEIKISRIPLYDIGIKSEVPHIGANNELEYKYLSSIKISNNSLIVQPNTINYTGTIDYKRFMVDIAFDTNEIKIPINVNPCPVEGIECRAITISEGIEEIPSDAFKNLEYLEKVNLPSTLKVIRTGAFNNCSLLKQINIGPDIIVEPEAFRDCKSLVWFEESEIANPNHTSPSYKEKSDLIMCLYHDMFGKWEYKRTRKLRYKLSKKPEYGYMRFILNKIKLSKDDVEEGQLEVVRKRLIKELVGQKAKSMDIDIAKKECMIDRAILRIYKRYELKYIK